MRPAYNAFKSKLDRFIDIPVWAFSWTTSPLSPGPPGGIPASETAQGEGKYNIITIIAIL